MLFWLPLVRSSEPCWKTPLPAATAEAGITNVVVTVAAAVAPMSATVTEAMAMVATEAAMEGTVEPMADMAEVMGDTEVAGAATVEATAGMVATAEAGAAMGMEVAMALPFMPATVAMEPGIVRIAMEIGAASAATMAGSVPT